MKLTQKLSFLALLLAGLAPTAQAALSVTGAGLATQTFATYPTSPGNFSTLGITGAAADYESVAAFDTAVTNTASTAVATALGGVSATNVGTAALARYNTNLGCIQICPTGNAGTLLMATFLNSTVSNITGFNLRYDYILRTTAPAAAELVPGLRVFFSTSGLPGSWQLLPTLSALNVSTTNATETISGISWAPNANAYVLWADDNSVPNNDWGNTIDNLGITGVTGQSLPATLVITSPTNEFQAVPCGNLTVATTTTGTITNVNFYLDGVLLTNDTTSPYGGTFQIPCGLAPGFHGLSAVAQDAFGNSVFASPIDLILNANLPPTIAITNAYCTNLVGASAGPNFLVGSMIIVQATYADDDVITNIEWQVDGALSLSNRIANTWFYLNALPGTHNLRGIATDRLGQQTISANYTITVTNPPSSTYTLLVTNGSDWRYYASSNGAQAEEIIPGLFVQWYDFNYSETGWSSGFAELGDGDIANGYAERTLIDIGPTTTKYSAIYFRKKFNVANPNAFPNLVLRLLRDDGAIVWLNGVSVWTNNMLTTTPDAVHPSALANTNRAAASDDGVNYYVLNLLNLPANPLLSAGENIIAVQVHNQNLTSSDLSFDLMLWGEADVLPRVNLTAPTNGQSIAQCSTTALAATATPYVTNVSFYANGVLLGSDATAPYTSSYTNTLLAPVQITAVALDSFGVMATSAPVTLNVTPNAVPTLAVTNIFSVTTGTVFLAGSSITNRYLATDDQAVVAVDFYLNGTLRYRDTAGFGSYVLNDAPAGNHTLTLVAFDNCGGSNSTSVSLTVTNPPLALLITNQSMWTYIDDGLTQDVSWVTLAFDDTGWSNGLAELGFGAVAEDNPPVTTIRRNAGVIATNSLVYYFRKVINVPDPSAYGNLILSVLRDDGARVYLNGTEVFTTSGLGVTNFPPAAAAGDDGTRYYSTNVSPSLLVAGPNIVAVEVRQVNVTSSDVAFDLMLWGEAGAGPALHIVSDGLTHTVTWTDASGQYVLQRTTNVGNPASWADVPGSPTSPYTQPAGAVPQFYRLRKP